MSQSAEPRNPFYFLLLVSGVLFTLTVLALAVLPALEKRWLDEGQTPPTSPLRDALNEQGLIWVVCEVAAIIVFGLASMGLDRYRRSQSERAAATIPAETQVPASETTSANE